MKESRKMGIVFILVFSTLGLEFIQTRFGLGGKRDTSP